MNILAIETSCDDTSVALLEIHNNTINILAEKTASQIKIHKKYGGVVPEIAGREHAENIIPVIEEVLQNQDKPDIIAVTTGPGLITGLIVGIEAAKTLSYLWDIPVVPINHIEGHLYSIFLDNNDTQIELPTIALTVSGGHTNIVLIKQWGEYVHIGSTRDDAAGETFDKVAKMLDLTYPGGPKISKLAETGNPEAIPFPRPMIQKDTFDLSFSGLKTAALYWLRDNTLTEHITKNDFCASIEQAIVDVLIHKTFKAVDKYRPKTILLVGGVSANKKLRETFKLKAQDLNIAFTTPNPKYSMDNAAMIGVAAYKKAKNKQYTHWKDIQADPNWDILQINNI
jgi:N6-L-threonylcarbamoyladenine synthase